jgi:2-desacetyl-2-hydroxyethyl bacteriochlorophyllide A dehydrogenase
MKAAFMSGPHALDVRDIELREPAANEMLIDVTSCGVCGSNLHEWPNPRDFFARVPGAFGHEVAGVVAARGADCGDWGVGDPLVVQPSHVSACGQCEGCRDGATWFCSNQRPIATYGFAEQMLVPIEAAYRLPDALPLDVALLVEPVACGVHAVRHSWTARDNGRIDGKKVVVIGAGMLGLGAIMAARWLGAAEVVAVARHEHQARAAAASGADTVLSSDAEGLAKTLRGVRPEMVVEAVGGEASTLNQAIDTVAWRGEVAVLGSFTSPQSIDAGRMVNRETRLMFAICYSRRDGIDDYDVTLDMLASGQFPLDGLVTHRFPIDAIDEAFRVASDKHSGAIRVAVGRPPR